jgi:hypothetical protein
VNSTIRNYFVSQLVSLLSLSLKTTKSPEDDVAVAMPGSVAVAVPAGKAMAVPMTQQPKQGGKCCGSCCDYRRAVIIISAISVLFTIISLARGEPEVQVEDDDLAKQFVAIQDDYKTNFLVLNIFSLIMALVSIVGAVQFNQHMVRNTRTETKNCIARNLVIFEPY